jgi:hypothetical protein
MGSNDITTREEKKSLPSQYCVLTGLYKNGYYYVTVCHKGAEDYCSHGSIYFCWSSSKSSRVGPRWSGQDQEWRRRHIVAYQVAEFESSRSKVSDVFVGFVIFILFLLCNFRTQLQLVL